MKIKFWGTRGSIATPEPEHMKYGGNTACVEVRTADGELIILDAGTGIRRLGASLLADETCPRRGSIIISHYHWDHIQGFPFFAPLYAKDWSFTVYGQFKVDGRLTSALAGQMGNLYFPVDMEAFGAELKFVEIIEQDIQIGQTLVTSRALNHPQGNLGFRFQDGAGIMAYVTDTEHFEDRLDEKVLELAQDADVMIYDAQYTPEQYPNHRGWGHSTWRAGVEVARAANVKTLVLFHHDPAATDEKIDTIIETARTEYPNTLASSRDLEITLEGHHKPVVSSLPRATTTVRSRLNYKLERDEQKVMIRPSSFLSVFNSEEFKQVVIDSFVDEVNTVVFDFVDLGEIDSLALGSMAYFLEEAEKKEINFYLCRANEFVREVLMITRFDQVIKIVDSLEDVA